MDKLRGYIGVTGRVSYVPQQPWMQNQTMRANITFGKKFDEYFYNRVLDACALYQDLQMLPMGDMTEIGEKVVYFFLSNKKLGNQPIRRPKSKNIVGQSSVSKS